MLGVFLAPDGNNEAQIKKMKDKATYYGEMIRTGHVDKYEAITVLKSMAMKSLEYSLPAMTLSQEECASITWPLYKAILPKAGINRYFPRNVLFGTQEMNGMGFKDIFLLQGISHISNLILHIWNKSITGYLMKQCLELLRLEIGISGNILQEDYYTFQPLVLTTSWIQHLWKFLTDYGIKIQLDIAEIHPKREQDTYIMEQIVAAKVASKKELKEVNECRIYLQAFTLSDIVSPDGKYINKCLLKGIKTDYMHQSVNWPLWQKPAAQSWTSWRRILRLVFTDGTNLKLLHPLSSWKHTQMSTWRWYLHRDGNSLIQRQKLQWLQHRKYGRSTRTTRFFLAGSTISPPDMDTLIPTTTSQARNTLRSTGAVTVVNDSSDSPLPLLEKLHPSKCPWLFHGLQRSTSISNLLDDMRGGKAIAASDGSYCKNTHITTAGWIIESDDGKEYVSGIAVPYFDSLCAGAYRGEVAGILAIVHMSTYLSLKHNFGRPLLCLSCDNVRALETSFQLNNYIAAPKKKHADLLSGVIGLMQLGNLNVIPHHV